MPDSAPDPRATLELLTRLDAEMSKGFWRTSGTDIDNGSDDEAERVAKCWSSTFAPPRAQAKKNAEGIAALRNALPEIIRDLRRLELAAEIESDLMLRIKRLESDCDAGWATADALAGALEQMAPVGLSDQARTALASYRAAEAARNPNPEGRT